MSALSTLSLPARFRRPATGEAAHQPRQFAGFSSAALWAVALFVLGLPLTMLMFEGAGFGLKLYLNGLITGLIASGGLLIAMIGREAAGVLDDARESTANDAA